MASTIYNGKFLRFMFDGKLLFHATTCKVSVSSKLEEIATKDTDGSIVVPSNYTWSGSTEALLAALPVGDTTHVTADELMDLQLSGTEIDVDFTTDITGDVMWTGTAFIESSDITADTGASVKVSISFKGNGNITKTTVPV